MKCQCCPHIETSQWIWTANQLTSFYTRETLALNELRSKAILTLKVGLISILLFCIFFFCISFLPLRFSNYLKFKILSTLHRRDLVLLALVKFKMIFKKTTKNFFCSLKIIFLKNNDHTNFHA